MFTVAGRRRCERTEVSRQGGNVLLRGVRPAHGGLNRLANLVLEAVDCPIPGPGARGPRAEQRRDPFRGAIRAVTQGIDKLAARVSVGVATVAGQPAVMGELRVVKELLAPFH